MYGCCDDVCITFAIQEFPASLKREIQVVDYHTTAHIVVLMVTTVEELIQLSAHFDEIIIAVLIGSHFVAKYVCEAQSMDLLKAWIHALYNDPWIAQCERCKVRICAKHGISLTKVWL